MMKLLVRVMIDATDDDNGDDDDDDDGEEASDTVICFLVRSLTALVVAVRSR